MKIILDGMSKQFKEGHELGVEIAISSVAQYGIDKARDVCEKIPSSYRNKQSDEFIFGMNSGINVTINDISNKIYGPRERMRNMIKNGR